MMSYWHKRRHDGWTCDVCESLEFGEYYCENCLSIERERRHVNVEVTVAGRQIVVEDFSGTMEEACAMVERHYPNATSAVIRIAT